MTVLNNQPGFSFYSFKNYLCSTRRTDADDIRTRHVEEILQIVRTVNLVMDKIMVIMTRNQA